MMHDQQNTKFCLYLSAVVKCLPCPKCLWCIQCDSYW